VNTYTSSTQGVRDRAISPYDCNRCRESSEKVGCSVGLACGGAKAAIDESVTVKPEGQTEIGGIKSEFLWGLV